MHFVFSGFLGALLVVVIPIAIHLLQLRRPQRVKFTNTGFIQDIDFKNGRRRLQDLLVLSLRVLMIVFLVLTFSQPFIPARVAGINVDNKELAVFVDNSLSMRIPDDSGISLVEKSLASIKQLSKGYKTGTRLRLIKKENRKLIANPLKTELGFSHQIYGWGETLVRREWEAKTDEPFYVFSDFQRSEAPPIVFRRISTTREVVLVPQVGKKVGNIYVDSVWFNDAFVRVRANTDLHIRLKNGGESIVRDCAVKVLIGGKQVAAFRTTVAAAQVMEIVAQVQVPNEQLVEGKILVEDSPVAFDNSYYFVLQPTTAIQVVEIGPAPITQAAYRREPLFQYHYSKSEQVNFGQVQQANLVLVNEATIISEGLQAALLAVTKRGGSVVIVPPATRVVQDTYRQLLRTLGAGEVQWESLVAEPVRQELAMPNSRSPFFREVFGTQPRQVVLPEVSPVLRLNGKGTDILRLRDGGGFLTEFGAGEGKVYVFSAPFNQKYSDFTSHALFVPVLYRLAMLSYQEDKPLAYRIGTKQIQLHVPATQATGKEETVYRLVHDSLTLVLAQRRLGQQLRLELPAELNEPGFYQLRRQDQVIGMLAFNQAKRESELAVYSAAELRQLVGPDRPNVRVLDEGNQVQALGRYRAEQTGQPLWRYCLLLALACLLAEGAVLRWGRRGKLAVKAS
ncbi:MAG: hypothetical protein EOO60_02960 [Hymenobacter sp.]|nr:MAG: hypothetical protein EOO60_02960 [Hymenobacter sp.]